MKTINYTASVRVHKEVDSSVSIPGFLDIDVECPASAECDDEQMTVQYDLDKRDVTKLLSGYNLKLLKAKIAQNTHRDEDGKVGYRRSFMIPFSDLPSVEMFDPEFVEDASGDSFLRVEYQYNHKYLENADGSMKMETVWNRYREEWQEARACIRLIKLKFLLEIETDYLDEYDNETEFEAYEG